MDLSWNPCTWTPSNLAEAAVETLTGSEFAGDIAGAVLGFCTGDIFSGYEQLADGLDNVAGFLGDSRVGDAADDWFGSGTVKSPDKCPCTDTGWEWPPITDNAPPSTTPTTTPTTDATGGSGGLGIDLGSMSLEDAIMILLSKIISDKRKDVRDKLDNIESKSKMSVADQEAAGFNKQDEMTLMQRDMNELQQMTSLMTNMMSTMHQMNQGIIQNIR